MNIFASIFAHKAVAVATAASLALGTTSVAMAHKADVERHESHEDKSKSEVHQNKKAAVDIAIGTKGRTLVHGATVTGVSGSTISARSSWGTSVINWTVNTASATKFLLKGEGTTTISAIATGDTVNFDGTLATTSGQFTVDAHIVRDISR